MILAKLITLDGEFKGECHLTEEHYTLDIESPNVLSFDCGLLILNDSTIPIPVMYGHSLYTNGLTTITGSLLKDFQGKEYKPLLTNECNEYHYRMNQKILDLFVQHGIATVKIVDRVLVCPECDAAMYTIRPGCPSCGSAFTKPDQLVHHYACGNVDFLELYTINRKKGSLTCGKCKKEDLIINVDYDVSVGLQRCQDCGWTGNGNKLIGRCQDCETSFLISEAKEIELKEYQML